MTEPEHPDQTLRRLVAEPRMGERKTANLQGVHKVCESMYARGLRTFGLAAVGKAVSEAGVLAYSTYLSKTSKEYQTIGEAWQNYADEQELALDPEAPPGHPDDVLRRLLEAPKRRSDAATTLRGVYKVCKARFERGERNFSTAAVSTDAIAAGVSEARIVPDGSVGYGDLLRAWQALADKRGDVRDPLLPPDHPEAVLDRHRRVRRVTSSTVSYLEGIQNICKARFDRGEYDFGPSTVARELVEAGVFTDVKSLVTRLTTEHRYRDILASWQQIADKQWIDTRPDLAPTHPHAVFRRLKLKQIRSDRLRILLGVHRVCYLHHATGSIDFSNQTIGSLLAGAGVVSRKHIHVTSMEDARTLVAAWANLARPWLRDENGAPPQIEPRRQVAHDTDLEWVRR